VGGKQYSFFVRPLFTGRVKATVRGPTFTPAVVLFVTLPETETNTDPG
jgi:hypothetical protein